MAAVVIAVAGVSEHPLVVLIVQVVAGAAVYTAASFVVWHWIGRPDGGERLVVEQLARIRAWRPAQ
jgi:hypothetical protein